MPAACSSTPLAQAMKVALLSRTVLHADETPVPMLKPGLGHTHRAYLWSYGTTQFDPLPLVVYDFAESRGGHHARAFLGGWSGKLVCDDFSGYKALFERGVIEIGCMAHARRKFHELHENQRSEIAAEALVFFGALYDIETEAREQQLDAIGRQRLRQAARPTCRRSSAGVADADIGRRCPTAQRRPRRSSTAWGAGRR